MARFVVMAALVSTALVVLLGGEPVAASPGELAPVSVTDGPELDDLDAPDPLQASCGDGRCQPPEDCNTCPQDCGDCCGNRRCEPPEDCNSCPQDCGPC